MNGFSLLELLVVLAIISVLGVLAAPRIIRKAQTQGDAQTVAARIKTYQRQAVQTGRSTAVVIGGTTFRFLPSGAVATDHRSVRAGDKTFTLTLDEWSGDAMLQ